MVLGEGGLLFRLIEALGVLEEVPRFEVICVRHLDRRRPLFTGDQVVQNCHSNQNSSSAIDNHMLNSLSHTIVGSSGGLPEED